MPSATTESRSRVDWRAVAVFMAIACAWSWPFFWWRDMHGDSFQAFPAPYPLKNALLMWGPGIAALACLRLFRASHVRTLTLFGGQRLRSLAFYFLPFVALGIAGVHMPEFGGTVHALVALLAVFGLLNMLGEELGWRGFLQDALRPLPRPGRYALIGVLWAGWHFTNLFAHREGSELWAYLAWYLPLTMLISAVLGEATDRARAVMVAATLHAWVNLLWELPGTGTYVVLGLALPFWAWLLLTWPRPEPAEGPPPA